MTELSYTAWDDNRYQWPPPDGWYQASDGKWWPEGYGPVASSATVDEGHGDSAHADADSHSQSGEEADAPDADSESHEHAVSHDSDEHAVSHDSDSAESPGSFDAHETTPHAEPAAASDETQPMSGIDANGGVEVDQVEKVAELDEIADEETLTEVASGFAGAGEPSYSSDSYSGDSYSGESQYSASSAGMAASGFATRSEGGSSSLGLAGWAQTGGSSEVRNRVDIGHEYDYTAPDTETPDLMDPIEVIDDDAAESPAEAPDGDHDPTPAAGSATALDMATQPVDSTLSRLDDLKRQVEQQSLVGRPAADATVPMSDMDLQGFDPTETLDIDPNDLTLESNPYYGGAEETPGYTVPSGFVADEAAATEADRADDDTDLSGRRADDQAFGDEAATASETDAHPYGFGGDADADAPEMSSAAETQQLGYDEGPPPAIGDQPIPMGDGFGAPQTDFSTAPVLTPMSSPPPKSGMGRTLLYAIIGLLALAVAGVAGYLLFQLQGDDDGAASDADATAATGTAQGGEAGASDTSGQGPGSFSNPHELLGGVRLTVPVGDDGTEVWMLQVREPATTSTVDDDQVEVSSRLRVRNDGTSGDLTASGLRFVLVSADGASGTAAAESCTTGDDLDRSAAIEPGKDIEGNVCWLVPAAQASGALLGIESVQAAGRVHVQLS